MDFVCVFLIALVNLDYNEADVKEVFNICLDQSLSLWEIEKLGNLGFWDFIYHVYHCGEPELPPQAKSHSTDCPPIPPAVSGSPSPPMTQKRRRKNGPAAAPPEAAKDAAAAPPVEADYAAVAPEAAKDTAQTTEAVMPLPHSRQKRKASSVPQGLEAIQEPTASPGAVPELPLVPALPARPSSFL
ncbi:uncharacterized protein LOC131526381 [Onychostoma macrolepis]|uniref:uncharacterized protein LOC131526381 n=1 Tax=Onychostoma macrolepis TaxID=369639 RepID=UPI00272DBBFB|nr:uncharacterized protein LOC131526381 [Onychostoma macrolepis]